MNLSRGVLICAVLSLILLLLYLCYRNVMRKIEGFPFRHIVPKLVYDQLMGKIPKGVPFNSYVFHTLTDYCKQNSKEGLFMTYLTRPVLIIFSEEAIRFFLNEKAAQNKASEYKLFADIIGNGLITSSGNRWRTHRKMINPVFHRDMLKEKIPLFNEYAMHFVNDIAKLAGKSSVDPVEPLKWRYFTSLSESVFGLKQNEENEEEVLKVGIAADCLCNAVVKRAFYPWLRPDCLLPFSAFGRKFIKDNKVAEVFIKKVINDMIEHVNTNEIVNDSNPLVDFNSHRFSKHLKKSITYILIKGHKEDPSFTFQDVFDNVLTTIAAGYDTIAYCTLWCLYMLGLHPEIQEKAFNEVLLTTDGYITYDDSSNLTYLEAVIMETLRLYPTVPLIGRNLTEDVQYGKYKVHKGTTIFFVSYVSHRNSEVYPNPEKFDPERFLSTEAKRVGTFLPFGEGSRICLGKRYAMIEMKIFLAYLLRNFKFITLNKMENIHPCWNVTLTPSEHIQMKFTSRQPEERHFKEEKESSFIKIPA